MLLHPSRAKWLIVFAGCILFALGGMAMIHAGNPKGWLALVFFGLGAFVAVIPLLPGASALLLDRDGFEVTSLFRRHRSRWEDTGGFTAGRIPRSGRMMVFYNDAKPSHARLAKFNLSIVGRNSGVPDTYGLSADDLARLMAQWRERSVGEAPHADRIISVF